MTASAVTPVPAPRPLWHRCVSALVVVQAGVFWLCGAAFFRLVAGTWNDVYVSWEIKSGLPALTRRMIDLYILLDGHWAAVCLYVGVAVVCLALLAALSPSRRAFRWAGWLDVACFLGWYAVLFIVPLIAWLPLANMHGLLR